MKSRIAQEIILRESNHSGGYYFMSIFTSRWLRSYIWEEFPIYDEVICQVEVLETEEDQKIMKYGYQIF